MRKILILACSIFLLSGCSWFRNDEPPVQPDDNTNMPEVDNKTMGIQDLLDEFEDNDIMLDNITEVDSVDFASQEGRTFELNGETMYLYRLNNQDAKYQTTIDQINEYGSVILNHNGVDEEYSAMLNSDYLLLYKLDADISPLDEVFSSYKMR